MVRREVIRALIGPIPMLSASALFLLISIALIWAAQNEQAYGEWYSALLIVNIVGIVTLSLFFLANLLRLIRQYHRRVMGSRLMVRFVLLFTVLTLLPIGIIYYFAVQFLSQGVDSWFDVKIEQALADASRLGNSFLEASKLDVIDKVKADAVRINRAETERALYQTLEEVRALRDFTEIALFSETGQIIASSNASPTVLFPDTPDDTDLREASAGDLVAKLEPFGDNSLQYRVLMPLYGDDLAARPRILQVIELLPLRYSSLAESLQNARTEYDRLDYLRQPLKISFIISLSLITLMTTLISLWLALYAARRLVAPISDLAEGTEAVASGNYLVKLPVKSDDEFGMLVTSFNSMTTQIQQAQRAAEQNQLLAEKQSAYLETVLTHLSSGVVSLNQAGELLTANESASAILATSLGQYVERNVADISAADSRIAPLIELIQQSRQKSASHHQAEVHLKSDSGQQTLSVRVTKIISETASGAREGQGCVVVFDDVTRLIHAQREAAWGEVARRLAHEIKNPLTPIQLSAERIRRKFMDQIPEHERDALDRSTRTISEQVDTMKRMVDAFSSYARSERLTLGKVQLNQLIEDVVDLHRRPGDKSTISLDLDGQAPVMQADKGAILQVLNNLLANANDAVEALQQGAINIRTQVKTDDGVDGVEITVDDNGAGFPEELIDQVFEPYVTSKAKGTGLGMAIVKRIIDSHGGHVRVRNRQADEHEQTGGRVRVWLPIAQHNAA